MSGSGASIMGYGDIVPNSNVNGDYVNVTGSNYAGNFSSNQIPGSVRSLPEPPSNVVAASGTWTGHGGGRRKRKNVGTVYKRMRSGKRTTRRSTSVKRHHKTGRRHGRSRTAGKRRGTRRVKSRGRKSRASLRRSRRTRRRASKRMRGGMYAQYDSNVPNTPGYGLAGSAVQPGMSAIANPPVYDRYVDCKDNYNHYAATQGK